jgi:FtsP/CotA-like multicopper oxidase with cupredoxin domain
VPPSSDEQASTNDHVNLAERPAALSRRSLLQLGAASLAVTVAVPSLLAGASQTPQTTPTPTPKPDPLIPPTAPSAEKFLNPAALSAETWCEPWIWRPEDWPGQALELNVVEKNEPDKAPSPGQIFPGQYSFGGISPAPTIRVRNTSTLKVRLRNLLGPSMETMPVGPGPDPLALPPDVYLQALCLEAKAAGKPCPGPEAFADPNFNPLDHLPAILKTVGMHTMDMPCMTHMSNSEHGSHVTNIHVHGLHVDPGTNANGTDSDNVRLRLLSREDWAKRQRSGDAACAQRGPHERVGHTDYEFVLGNVQRAQMRRQGRAAQPDPPGTFWYHPHAHGSTHDQVASGMAGFLIIEGDVDDAINKAMTGETRPDPCQPAGRFDYRERLVFLQRVILGAADLSDGPGRRQRQAPNPVPESGVPSPTVMFMRPGAVERWRILNGSVDGRGFTRFMVLDGHYIATAGQLWRVVPGEGENTRRLVPVARGELDTARLPLYQLAFDGITLVTVEDGKARHTIKDLSKRNANRPNPMCAAPQPGDSPSDTFLRNFEACFRDGDSIRDAFVRPNEVWMATANRADVFFKAPANAAGRVFTVIAQEEVLHTDNTQNRLQRFVQRSGRATFNPGNPAPTEVVVGYVHVRGTPVEGGDFDVMSLRDVLPPVPPYLQPIGDEELRVPAAEAAQRRVPVGSYRTRVVSYTGYGAAGFPIIEVPESFAAAHPELKNLVWTEVDGAKVLLAPAGRTMAINNQFDLAKHPDPPPPQKFSPDHPDRIRVVVDTAEEWVLYNASWTLWGHTDFRRFPQPGHFGAQYRGYPMSRAEGQARFKRDPEFQIVATAADHPFHIHTNPMWVTRIEVADEQGRLHNILTEPRWMDTVSIPRNAGRVVFRSRFADFTGRWIHHCHILMHEDMGMMQEVECTASAAQGNANPRTAVARHDMTEAEVNAIYPRPSAEICYRQGLSFVDPNPMTGQEFPGFRLEAPVLKD